MKKPKIVITVNKAPNGSYSVFQMTFDQNGNTVFHGFIGKNLSRREAYDLKKEAMSL